MFANAGRLMWGSIMLAVVAAVAASYSIARNSPVKNQREPVFGPSARPRDFQTAHGDLIGAVGVIEPASELIAVGSSSGGIVKNVSVRPGDHVDSGDELFVIDDRTAAADLAAACEELKATQARLREIEAQVQPAEARVASCEASLSLARVEQAEKEAQLRRSDALSDKGVVSREEYEQKRFAFESATARVADAQSKLRESRATLALLQSTETSQGAEGKSGPTIDVQRAAVSKAFAAVTQAKVKIELQTVRSPIAATVLQVRVRPGEYVPAAVVSDPLMVLGVTNPLHVRVEIDEAEIFRFRTDAQAVASPRGVPDCRANLTFVRVEPLVVPKRVLANSTSERVDTRVMQVIYSFEPSELPTRVGQQVDVFIEGPSPEK